MARGYTDDQDGVVSIGRVFSRAFGVITGNPGTVLGVPFVFGALPGLIFKLIVPGAGYAAGFAGRASLRGLLIPSIAMALGVILLLGSIALWMTAQGALVRATVAYSDEGRLLSFGEAARAGLRVSVRLFAMWVLFSISVSFGLVIFFMIPGIILCAMWAVTQPALVEERTSVFGAFGRSYELTKGSRWIVFALGLIMIAISLIYFSLAITIGFAVGISNGAQVATGAVGWGLLLVGLLVNAASSTVFSAMIATIQASLYVELRNAKEGAPGEALAQVFA
ncbi:MAG: hypothetical protein ABI240_02910 [Sphingomonas sp.]